MIFCSAILGVIGFWLGFFLAAVIGADPGPTVIVTMTGIFVLVLILAPRYGLLADWIREANAVPQEIMEDVLGAMLREPGKAIPIAQIQKRVTDPNIKVRQAINKLAKQDYLEVTDGAALLTENGRRKQGGLYARTGSGKRTWRKQEHPRKRSTKKLMSWNTSVTRQPSNTLMTNLVTP